MADEPTPGVLLRGADGSHYFIPHTELSGFSVENPPTELAERLEGNAPRLDAFQVHRTSGDAPAAEAFLVGDDY
jgi:hypothetical protein